MKKEGLGWTFFGAFGAGALIMYFGDPNRGRCRRATLRDAFVHSGHEGREIRPALWSRCRASC